MSLPKRCAAYEPQATIPVVYNVMGYAAYQRMQTRITSIGKRIRLQLSMSICPRCGTAVYPTAPRRSLTRQNPLTGLHESRGGSCCSLFSAVLMAPLAYRHSIF